MISTVAISPVVLQMSCVAGLLVIAVLAVACQYAGIAGVWGHAKLSRTPAKLTFREALRHGDVVGIHARDELAAIEARRVHLHEHLAGRELGHVDGSRLGRERLEQVAFHTIRDLRKFFLGELQEVRGGAMRPVTSAASGTASDSLRLKLRTAISAREWFVYVGLMM